MDPIRYFQAIVLGEWPCEAIYRRLGFRRSSTRVTQKQREEIGRYIQEARDIIRLQGAFRRLPVAVEAPDRVLLPEDLVMVSRNLADFLGHSREIVLMGATAGNGIMAAITENAEGDEVTRAVVLDATASEAVDAALDWMMAYLNQGFRREGKALTKARYSAGYGDLALDNQRHIHRLLGMDHLGVSMTESCILVPEKSVTAIAGIKA